MKRKNCKINPGLPKNRLYRKMRWTKNTLKREESLINVKTYKKHILNLTSHLTI